MNAMYSSLVMLIGLMLGSGLLAMPFKTIVHGFNGSVVTVFVTGCFSLATLLIFNKVISLQKKNTDTLFSISADHFSKPVQYLSHCCFMLTKFFISISFTLGFAQLISSLAQQINIPLSVSHAAILSVTCIMILIHYNILYMIKLNLLLMIFKILSFVTILTLSFQHGHYVSLFSQAHIEWHAVPVIFAAFTAHPALPSLRKHLVSSQQKLSTLLCISVIFSGFAIFLYLLSIDMLLPHSGQLSMGELTQHQQIYGGELKALFYAIDNVTSSTLIIAALDSFTLTALAMPWLSSSLSCIDFIEDALERLWKVDNRSLASVITFIPSLFTAIFFPHAFTSFVSWTALVALPLYVIIPTVILLRQNMTQSFLYHPWILRLILVLTCIIALTQLPFSY